MGSMDNGGYWDKFWKRRTSRRQVLRASALGATGLVAAGVVGCGDDDDDEGSNGGPSSTRTSGPVGAPQSGGTIRISYFPQDITPNMDPHLTHPGFLSPFRMVWGRLVRFKINTDDSPSITNQVEGYMAETWEQPDPLTINFKIREDVRWHPPLDRPFTAEDVVYSLTRQRAVKDEIGIEGWEGWETIDENTVQVKLEAPNPDVLLGQADSRNALVAQENVEEKGDLKEGPVIGTGAFMLKEWIPDQVTRLEKYPNFHIPGQPYLDQIDVPQGLQDSTIWQAAFRTGDMIDYFGGGPGGTIQSVRQMIEEFPDVMSGRTDQTFATNFVWAPTHKGPTQDPRVRTALSKAIDRQVLIDAVSDGEGALLPPNSLPGLDWLTPDIDDLLAYDPQGARQLLEQAGQLDWKPVVTHRGDTPIWGLVAELVQAQWKEIGLEVTLGPVDEATVEQKVWRDGDIDLAIDSGRGIASPTASLLGRFKTGGSSNPMQLSDPELDSLIEAQALAETEEERREIFRQIQKRTIEAAAYIPLYGAGFLNVWRPQLHAYAYGLESVHHNPNWDQYWLSA